MEMPVCLNFMNNRNNTVPTGLWPPRCNTATKTSCLWHLAGSDEEPEGSAQV